MLYNSPNKSKSTLSYPQIVLGSHPHGLGQVWSKSATKTKSEP